MDVGLDEARRNQAAAEIDGLALGREAGLDRGDPSAGDADIGQFVLGAEARAFLQNEVHGFLVWYSMSRSKCGAAIAEIGPHKAGSWPTSCAVPECLMLPDCST